MADDFLCEVTGPITEIYVWGSWLWDEYPGSPENVTFVLSIHEDIPLGPDGWSIPGDLLWLEVFGPGTFYVDPYAGGLQEGWYDPSTGEYVPFADTICWWYYFPIPPGLEFIQQGSPCDPLIYWLDVQAFPEYESYFGWKTSTFHWNDDAVWALGQDPPAGPWTELIYPPGHLWEGTSIDLAFGVHGPATVPTGACCLSDGSCIVTTEECCTDVEGGDYQGNGSTCGGMQACCDPVTGNCADADAICCVNELGGTPQGGGTSCTATEACCFTDGSCENLDPLCCDDQGGYPSPSGEPQCLGDANGNDVNDACEILCEPTADGAECRPADCDDPQEVCLPKCVDFDPITGENTVVECECRDPGECRVDLASGNSYPCVRPDNGTGTATLPPIGCRYLDPYEDWMIIDGLPAGTTIRMDGLLMNFICSGQHSDCSLQLSSGQCEMAGGTLGGDGHCYEATLDLTGGKESWVLG